MTDRPTDIDDVLNHRRDACQKPLDMSDAAQKAFADRQEKLIRSKRWPILNWYNDDDFCRAYNTAVALKAERDAQAAELARLRAIVSLAKMLIQPTAVGGPILEGHQRFREDLMRAVRGMKYTDPRDVEIDRLRRLEEAAIHWSTHRCVHGVGRLERAVEEAQKAR